MFHGKLNLSYLTVSLVDDLSATLNSTLQKCDI